MTWPNYSPACRKAVNDLLKKGGSLSAYRANKDYGVEPVKGSYAWKLERELEKRFKIRHAVAVNSGTAALHAGLRSLGLTREDEVITSPYSFSATPSAILLAGGTPVFADVDPYTFCITKETVKRVITKRTRAILPVHLFGAFHPVDALREFGLPIIEDACQAVGAHSGGVYSGGSGLAGAYSFNGAKNIPAGECGALVTNDAETARKARLLANHGENFGERLVGLNYRPNEVTCCIAYHGLLELEPRNEKRRQLVDALHDRLGSFLDKDEPFFMMLDGRKWIDRPTRCGKDHVFYCYPFKLSPNMRRDLFIKRMAKQGVKVGAGYIQPPLHKYKAFQKYQTKPLPVVEEFSSKTLCLLYDLTPDKPLSYAEHVADCMRKALE